jgi:hypothetical protein
MSFALTAEQMRTREKSVTRRLGWAFLRPGDLVCAIEQGQGLKKGERVKRMVVIQVIDAYPQRLRTLLDHPDYGEIEAIKEGFPSLSPAQFVERFCLHNRVTPETMVNRVEFEFVERGIPWLSREQEMAIAQK